MVHAVVPLQHRGARLQSFVSSAAALRCGAARGLDGSRPPHQHSVGCGCGCNCLAAVILHACKRQGLRKRDLCHSRSTAIRCILLGIALQLVVCQPATILLMRQAVRAGGSDGASPRTPSLRPLARPVA